MAEEINLLHREGGRGGGGRGQLWRCRLLGSLAGIGRPRRSRCVVCLQVQHVTGMPAAAEGRRVVVGWRSKGGGGGGAEGEHTSPARVSRGTAAFDEVFLNYFSAGGATLRGFAVWAALVADSPSIAGGDLGCFPVDLTEIATAERESSSSNPIRFGGKALSFPLSGAAAGAVLTVSVYCRVMDHDETHAASAAAAAANGHARGGRAERRKNKGKGSYYASCLPDLSCLRNHRPSPSPAAAGSSARRAASLRSDRGGGGFITIENSNSAAETAGFGPHRRVADEDDADEGFITMEKGTISSSRSRSRSHRPPLGSDDDEDEKPCLLMELEPEAAEAAAVAAFEVEEEFLAMLEDKYWARSKEIEKGLGMSLDVGMDLGLDLDSLIKDAEMELAKAEQAWRSKVGAAIVEEEEYNDLLRRWSARDAAAGCWPAAAFAFGSPI
uniref:C2 NT-type domain-containing protein n=1 Tax=Leersia perrieri TaxID=77586 RepID=A0A0D9VMN9_9ORYZ